MSVTVNVSEELAARLAAEAARRGVSVDDLAAEMLTARLPSGDDHDENIDPLEAFIGSGSSGRGDLGRRHREIRAEITTGVPARDL